MGAGASALPAQIDLETAKQFAGDRFDEKAFTEAAKDGSIARDEFLKRVNERSHASREADEVSTSQMRPAWDVQKQDAGIVAVALSLGGTRGGDFLGSEVKEIQESSTEARFIQAWQALGRGDVDKALELADGLLVADKTAEKVYYTRAVCHARKASWRYAMADYSMYLKLVQATSGPSLANALYGRALCLAKLGKRALALRDLDEAIRVGPADEQVTEENPSLVPMATIARFTLLQACPELRKAAAKAAAEERAAAAAKPTSLLAVASAASSAASNSTTSYEGALWRVEMTDLEVAIERALASGKTPLLLDSTPEKAVDAYYMYSPSEVIEAKRLVLDVRVAGVGLEAAREQVR